MDNQLKQNVNLAFVDTYNITLPKEENFSPHCNTRKRFHIYTTELFTLTIAMYIFLYLEQWKEVMMRNNM